MNEHEIEELAFTVSEELAKTDSTRYIKEGDAEDVINAVLTLGYEVRKLSA